MCLLDPVYTTKPSFEVEYSLTDFGKTLIPLLELIAQWGKNIATDKAQIITILEKK